MAVIDTPKTDGDNRPSYNKVYTFKANSKTYYLAVSQSIGSTKDAGQGIQIFAIANDKLTEVKMIKTQSGLHSSLKLEYDFFSVVDWNIRPDITFNPVTQTISLPLVVDNGKMTHQTISYRFNGQYFEKVKS